MEKEIQLFVQLPELLLCGDNNGIIYDRKEVERKFLDRMQRPSDIWKPRNRDLLLKECFAYKNNKEFKWFGLDGGKIYKR